MRKSRSGRPRRSASGPSARAFIAAGRARPPRNSVSGMTVRAMDRNIIRAPMIERPTQRIAVILERRPIESRWQTHQWQVAGVVPDPGGERRVLSDSAQSRQVLYPGFEATLFVDEAEGHYLNVSTEEPS